MSNSGSDGGMSGNGDLSFLHARQHVIRLAPLDPAQTSGYVWSRVFLGGKPHARAGFWG